MHNNKITTNITNCVKLLELGELVAFPTETVYGLGADATNLQAVQKVFSSKGRPADHPLIVHLATDQQLALWARDISNDAWQLAQHFWPGPLTMILFKQTNVSNLITGNQDTIALRVPQHPMTLQLLKDFDRGIVGPSANKYGRVSPTTAQHVAIDLEDAVGAILDGGPCNVGIESTIINLTASQPIVMRQGAITAAEISKVLGKEVALNTLGKSNIRVSGSHASHYAPATKVVLVESIDLLPTIQQQTNIKFSVMSFSQRPEHLNSAIYWQQVANDPKQYAHDLYANLRIHDQLQNKMIFIETPPSQIAWFAILDRLTRAAN